MPSNRPRYYDPMLVTMSDEMLEVDVCVYGGTAAGVAAALQVARQGRSVVLLEPSTGIGGPMCSWSGIGNRAAVGGLARSFQQALAQHYAVDPASDAAWSWEP